MMLVNIVANKPLQTFYLEDLHENKINFQLNTQFDLAEGWYKLVIEYPGSKLKIEDIRWNDIDLSFNGILYTGWFKQDTGEMHSPGTVLYTHGQYEIWLHTNTGLLYSELFESILMDDFGMDLFEKYMHTVDKPLNLIGEGYPSTVKGFFEHGYGPKWWRKDSIITPYKSLDSSVIAGINKNKVHKEMQGMCEYITDSKYWAFPAPGETIKGGRVSARTSPYLPYTELDDVPGEELKKLCECIGLKRMLCITLQTQYPGEAFQPHVDTHKEMETKHNMQGACSFVLDLSENSEGHYFKVAKAGLIPIEHGTFFNFNYCHGTFNNSDVVRPLAILFGERDRDIDWYLN